MLVTYGVRRARIARRGSPTGGRRGRSRLLRARSCRRAPGTPLLPGAHSSAVGGAAAGRSAVAGVGAPGREALPADHAVGVAFPGGPGPARDEAQTAKGQPGGERRQRVERLEVTRQRQAQVELVLHAQSTSDSWTPSVDGSLSVSVPSGALERLLRSAPGSAGPWGDADLYQGLNAAGRNGLPALGAVELR